MLQPTLTFLGSARTARWALSQLVPLLGGRRTCDRLRSPGGSHQGLRRLVSTCVLQAHPRASPSILQLLSADHALP